MFACALINSIMSCIPYDYRKEINFAYDLQFAPLGNIRTV